MNKYAKSDEEVFHFLINSDSTWQKYLLRAFISVRIERMLTREGLSEKRPVRPRKKEYILVTAMLSSVASWKGLDQL